MKREELLIEFKKWVESRPDGFTFAQMRNRFPMHERAAVRLIHDLRHMLASTPFNLECHQEISGIGAAIYRLVDTRVGANVWTQDRLTDMGSRVGIVQAMADSNRNAATDPLERSYCEAIVRDLGRVTEDLEVLGRYKVR